MPMPFHPDLHCAVKFLHYDFTTRTGALHMAQAEHCEMPAAIALFERIDPGVERIAIVAGAKLIDTFTRSIARRKTSRAQ